MSKVFRFRMSGRTFAFDDDEPVTALDLCAFDEVGIDPVVAIGLLQDVADGKQANGIRALRAICALAYLSALREGSTETWREFARTIQPDTLEFVPEPVQVAPVVEQAGPNVDDVDDDLAAKVTALIRGQAGP